MVVNDQVYLNASGNGKVVNEFVWETLVQKHGKGPFRVTGIGPKNVGIFIPDLGKSVNVPHSWVRKN